MGPWTASADTTSSAGDVNDVSSSIWILYLTKSAASGSESANVSVGVESEVQLPSTRPAGPSEEGAFGVALGTYAESYVTAGYSE